LNPQSIGEIGRRVGLRYFVAGGGSTPRIGLNV
jgi:hypothetical protein